MTSPAVRLGARAIERRFGPVVANDGTELVVRPSTVHAVVGENGAGKTTLMRILYGLDRPDSGTVVVDDEPVKLKSPADALARGIGMVHQEFKLVPELTLLENLILGREPTRLGRLDWAAARSAADALATQARIGFEWDVPVEQCPVSTRQRLEILRLLYRGADTLILDEPTAVLAPAQIGELLTLLGSLRDDGHTIVFISHKLHEVVAIADEITVLREGRSVAHVTPDEVDVDRLAELMIGEAVPQAASTSEEDTDARTDVPRPGPVVLSAADVVADDDRGLRRVAGATLEVRVGEIVGIAGVAGNGQQELVECLVGTRRLRGGTVQMDGVDLSDAHVAERRAHGLAYVSSNRAGEGLATVASLADNAIAGHHRGATLARGGWLRPRAIARFVTELLRRFSVRHASRRQPVSTLSGGNQQRLVIGREFASDPVVVIADQPARGLDVKGVAFVHEQLRSMAARGVGLLLVSEDLEELLALSDRVLVMYRGRVAGEVPGGSERRQIVGALMVGEEPAA